jgi:selenocysteine-specific elongation factor
LLAEALEQAGPRPESVDELSRTFGPDTLRLLKVLEKQKRAVAVAADRYFSPAAVQELLNAVQAAVPSESGVTASQLREILGVTRKYLIPFLEYCDRQRISTRSGDVRIFHWKG